MIDITLTWSEVMMASQAGCMRNVQALYEKQDPQYEVGHKNDWQIDIEGALGECALAKFLKIYWSGKGVKGGHDVGNYEVRTGSNPNHQLILHKKDKNEDIYWLVVGFNGNYSIKGWIKAKDGKQKKYWKDPNKRKHGVSRPAYFVPQSQLNDPEDKSYEQI